MGAEGVEWGTDVAHKCVLFLVVKFNRKGFCSLVCGS